MIVILSKSVKKITKINGKFGIVEERYHNSYDPTPSKQSFENE